MTVNEKEYSEGKLTRRLTLFIVLVLSLATLYHQALTQEQQCRLKIVLIDGSTKKPVPGVIRCLRHDEKQVIPIPGLLARGQGLDDKTSIQDWYVLPETTEVSLPRQPLKLQAFAGVESELATVSLDLTRETEKSISIPLHFFSQIMDIFKTLN